MFFRPTRRDFLYRTGAGLGSVALSALLGRDEARAGVLSPKPPHHAPKAKACIFLMMDGGPSHIDTFDTTPKLDQLHMTEFVRPAGSPILDMEPAAGVTPAMERENLDTLAALNKMNQRTRPEFKDLAERIESYELAYRMQAEMPPAVNIEKEPQETRDLYGIGGPETDSLGRRCLMARRLVEKGVRL